MPEERDARIGIETQGRPRSRWALAAAAVLGTFALAALLALSVATLPLGSANVRVEVERQLASLTGRTVAVDGTVAYSILPRPRMVLGDVRMAGSGTDRVLSVDQVQAEFDGLDALLGLMELDRLVLVRPELEPVFGEPAEANRSAATAQGAGRAEPELLAVLQDFATRLRGVRTVELRDGLFRPDGTSEAFTAIDAVLDWPAPAEPIRARGTFVWNGQRTEFALRAERPDRFLAGASSPVELALAAPPLEFELRGTANALEPTGFEGLVSLAAPSLPRAARWLSEGGAGLPDIGPVTLAAAIATQGERAALREVRVGVGDQEGQGVLEAVLSPEGRTSIAGTLAFPRLDLDRFTRGVAPLPSHALDFQRPIAIDFARAFDLDLRLSAAEAALGGTAMRQLAASVMFSSQTAKLDISDAELLGGRAQASLSIDLAGARPLAEGRIDLHGVDATALGATGGLDAFGLSGRADVAARFEAPATNWAEILRLNTSTVEIEFAEGGSASLAPELFDTAGETALFTQAAGTPTRFSRLTATLGTRGPYATIEALRMSGPSGTLDAAGFLALLDRRIFVDGAFAPAAGDDLFTSRKPVSFRMEGDWPRPTLTVGTSLGITPI